MTDNFTSLVLELTKEIPFGRVSTYKILAARLGCPKAARAVGNALNKNPNLINTPCHRVVKSNGCLGGYQKGARKKQKILEQEGIEVLAGKIKDFNNHLYFFNFGQ